VGVLEYENNMPRDNGSLRNGDVESLCSQPRTHIIQMNQASSPSVGQVNASLDELGMADAKRLSDALLRLYESAHRHPIETFQGEAIALLGGLLQFDSAWWARGTFDGECHRVHCSHLHRLPDDIPELVNFHDKTYFVGSRVTQAPGRALWFGPQDWLQQPSMAFIAGRMGVEQFICIAYPSGIQGLFSFLAVARRSASQVFDRQDRQLLETLMPHLTSALDMCCDTHMGQLHKGDEICLVTTDAEGWLYASESGVDELLRLEWPQWTPPKLPAPLVQSVLRQQSRFLGRKLRADIRWSGQHALVTLRRLAARDLLTAQECSVAEAFSSGLSYKEVAQRMNLAPSTVRHHLRAVYLKLNVSDKGALARAMK
jgi:DNA-binding CsgD family transcriptional regulator